MNRHTLCVVLTLVLVGTARAEQISLLTDSRFDRGFVVLAPEHPPTVQGNLQWDTSGGPPVWELGQWNSQSTIWGVTPTQLPSGAWWYENADKEIIVGGGPSADESDLVLTINGINEYGGQFRGPSDPWPHLLIQQRISDPGGQIGSQSPSIADMTSLDFHIDARLLYDNRTLTAGYNPSLHASQYNIFYTVQNLNTASTGYGDFLWFGTALYDDRYGVTGRMVMVDNFSQKLIYGIGIEPFTSEHIADGNWISVRGDLLPHMKAALDTAWSQGILLDSQDYADYRIGGVNLGWEMAGLNDASLQIRNYSVVANVGAQSFLPFQDNATTRGLWHMDETRADYGNDSVDDDNTFGVPGRPDGRELLLGDFDDFGIGGVTHPAFLPTGGRDGNGALEFDGVNDVALAYDVWDDPADRISIDFQMLPDSLPNLGGDNFMGIVGVLPLYIYLQDDGSGTGNLVALAFNEHGNSLYGFSQGGLELGQWHDVHVEVTNTGGVGFGVLSLTVDDVTNSFNMAALLNTDWDSMAVIGRDMNTYSRYFDGVLDEIRIATDAYVAPPIPGDANGDGQVDNEDATILAENWQRTGDAIWAMGDFNGDNNVDGFDATILAANWQAGITATVAVPEPSAAMLLLGGALVCGMLRLRNQIRRGR